MPKNPTYNVNKGYTPPKPKRTRNIIISTFTLLTLFVVAGIAYTYFFGNNKKADIAPAATTTKNAGTIKPVKPAANAKEGVAIEMLDSPVKAGSNTSVSARTNAGSKCKISVLYGQTAATDSGLKDKIADEYGGVSWTWTVPVSAPIGNSPVKVTCTYNGRTGLMISDLQITK